MSKTREVTKYPIVPYYFSCFRVFNSLAYMTKNNSKLWAVCLEAAKSFLYPKIPILTFKVIYIQTTFEEIL